jgi:hypothetical protein
MKALLFLMTAASLAAAAPVPKEFLRRTDFSPMAVGDKREYVSPTSPDVVTQVREITAVEEKGGARYYSQTLTGGTVTVMKAEKRAVYMVEQSGQKLDPPYRIVFADMKEGDSWKCNDPTGMTRTIGKLQEVVTPAGTFNAYPVTCSYPDQPGMSEVVVWYADRVGLVRLDSGGRTSLVLKKYTPGKDPK